MAIASTTKRVGGPLLAALFLAACGGSAPNDIPLENFTAAEIYQRGEFELSKRNPDDAAIFFSEIERLYPYSEWAKRALIMQAFSYHRDRDYPNSRAAARRIRTRPTRSICWRSAIMIRLMMSVAIRA